MVHPRDIPGWEWKWKSVTVYIGSNDICSGSCQGMFTGKQLHILRKQLHIFIKQLYVVRIHLNIVRKKFHIFENSFYKTFI